jgi:hypothetical protein
MIWFFAAWLLNILEIKHLETVSLVRFYVLIGMAVLLFIASAIHSIRQKAQFSIRSVLIFTFGVAVLCSIYQCLGFWAVFLSVFTFHLVTTACVEADSAEPISRRR